ncbi:putative TLC domain [Paratrimastix pyriformis]|uniref:TLC domain n=1 Tax=Paratrimastix pyriformis TaxID=342808 RepID=A0ABQ8UX43_9EUKA|nr:putative TLC domain [Paratrimastix pyriformis]
MRRQMPFVARVANSPVAYIPVFFVLEVSIRLLLEHLIFGPWAETVVNPALPVAKRLSFIRKFKAEASKTVYYIVVVALELRFFATVPQESGWIFQPSRMWSNYLSGSNTYEFPHMLLFIFTIQAAFYVHLLVFHFIEPKNKDFIEMLVHHVATLALLVICRRYQCMTAGISMLALHDLADVFVGPAKMCNWAGFQWAALANFLAMTAIWLVTRLVYYPLLFIPSVYADMHAALVASGAMPGWVYRTVLVGLVTLLGLHGFWFSAFVRMIKDSIRSRRVYDGQLTDDVQGALVAPQPRPRPCSGSGSGKLAAVGAEPTHRVGDPAGDCVGLPSLSHAAVALARAQEEIPADGATGLE